MKSGEVPYASSKATSSGGMRWLRKAVHRLTVPVAAMWIAYAVMVLCNVLFETLRLGGTTSSEVSGQVFAWFTPAGYVFAIWGVIYLALFTWLAYLTWSASRGGAPHAGSGGRARRASWRGASALKNAASVSRSTSVLFVASCALNVVWLVLFHFEQTTLALAVIAVLWVNLVALYVVAWRGSTGSRLSAHAGAGLRERAMIALGWAPGSVYLAWVTVAVIANASHVLTRTSGVGAPLTGGLSTIVLAIGVLLLGYFMRMRYADGVMQAVFLWAIVGVGVHALGASPLVAAALFALAVFAVVVTYVPADILRTLRTQAAA